MLNTACEKDDPEPKEEDYDEITNVTVTDNFLGMFISWDAVDDAKSYMVSINEEADSDLPITGTSYNPTIDIQEGDEVKVEAFSDPNTTDLIAVGTIIYEGSTDDSDNDTDDSDDTPAYTMENIAGRWTGDAGDWFELSADGSFKDSYDAEGGPGSWELDGTSVIIDESTESKFLNSYETFKLKEIDGEVVIEAKSTMTDFPGNYITANYVSTDAAINN